MIWSRPVGPPSINSLDTTFIEAENPGVAALLFKIGQQIVPSTEEFAAVIADNPRVWLRLSRYSQPDSQAVGTLKVIIEVLGGHGGSQLNAAMAVMQERLTPLAATSVTPHNIPSIVKPIAHSSVLLVQPRDRAVADIVALGDLPSRRPAVAARAKACAELHAPGHGAGAPVREPPKAEGSNAFGQANWRSIGPAE